MPRKVTAMALSILGVVRTAGSVRRMAVRALVGVRASLGSRVLFGRNDRRLACLLHHRDKGRSRWAPFANITVDVDFPVYPRGFTLCAISTLRKGLSRAKLPFFAILRGGGTGTLRDHLTVRASQSGHPASHNRALRGRTASGHRRLSSIFARQRTGAVGIFEGAWKRIISTRVCRATTLRQHGEHSGAYAASGGGANCGWRSDVGVHSDSPLHVWEEEGHEDDDQGEEGQGRGRRAHEAFEQVSPHERAPGRPSASKRTSGRAIRLFVRGNSLTVPASFARDRRLRWRRCERRAKKTPTTWSPDELVDMPTKVRHGDRNARRRAGPKLTHAFERAIFRCIPHATPPTPPPHHVFPAPSNDTPISVRTEDAVQNAPESCCQGQDPGEDACQVQVASQGEGQVQDPCKVKDAQEDPSEEPLQNAGKIEESAQIRQEEGCAQVCKEGCQVHLPPQDALQDPLLKEDPQEARVRRQVEARGGKDGWAGRARRARREQRAPPMHGGGAERLRLVVLWTHAHRNALFNLKPRHKKEKKKNKY